MSTEPSLKIVDAAYLTGILRRSGALGDGGVRSVEVLSSRATLLSRIARLNLTYEGTDAIDAPRALFLKTGLPRRGDSGWIQGRREVAFYTEIAAATTEGLVPRCFDAMWDVDTNDWHILLEDLTESHVLATTWPLPPSVEQCEIILDARARFHALWWDDPRLGVSIGTRNDTDTAARYTRDLTLHFARFADLLGDRLPRERREIYELVLDAVPRLLGRHCSHRNVTITHGDAHVWNAFLPRDERDGVRLFDWDSWGVGIASSDLAYMMAVHWYPDRRRRFERSLLDNYHAVLVAHGVRGYARSDLDDDYRLSVLLQIMIPVRQAAYDIPPMIWWSHLERIMLAVDDLGCRELLG